MGRIPPLTTLRVEDFPDEERSWLPRLFIPLNQFLTFASTIINGQIQFGPNIPTQDTVLDFVYAGQPQKYRWSLTFAPSILWVGQAFEENTAFIALPIWSYDQSSQNISVDFVKPNGTALTTAKSYKIMVRVVP